MMAPSFAPSTGVPQPEAWYYAFLGYGILIFICFLALPSDLSTLPASGWIAMGVIGFWRYGWLCLHGMRAAWYHTWIFSRYRRKADIYRQYMDLDDYPSVGFVVPCYKMPFSILDRVFSSLLAEAMRYQGPVVIVAAVTTQEEVDWIKKRFLVLLRRKKDMACEIFLQDGTGKRPAMAEALRRLKAHGSPLDTVVLMDGDTVIQPKTLENMVGFFQTQPDLGAVTIDNKSMCVGGDQLIGTWYALRMLQRHWLMSSLSLSRRVLVLTGRFSAFRGSIALTDGFIEAIESDALNHWRHGRLSMVTGDDKSTWFYLLKQKWAMLYIPDMRCDAMEDPADPKFLTNAFLLMQRWFGNMMRTSDRAIALGPRAMPFFVWWCLVDQRLSMWTAMVGPVGIGFLAVVYHAALIPLYVLWVVVTRFLCAGLMSFYRGPFHPYFPALLFFGQLYGACVKIHAMFRLHHQRWTRQMDTKVKETLEQHRVSWLFEVGAYGLFLFIVACFSGLVVVRL